MRAIALALAFLACGGQARRVQPTQEKLGVDEEPKAAKKGGGRMEVYLMDALAPMAKKIDEHAQHWTARGLALCKPAAAFQGSTGAPARRLRTGRTGMSPQMSVGLYYSTSTGNTETVAEYIADAAGISDWKDIGDVEDGEVEKNDAIIVGAPTWHTGADSERSGTSWDEWLYDKLPNIDLSGKKVAIFGVGDSGSYSDNYCDAAGELYDQFTARGATVVGMTPSDEGFDYTESKSVVDGKFVGRMFDEDNYSDESEERAKAWVEQLKSEGFM